MAKAKASIFKNIRTAMAMAVPPSAPSPTTYRTLFGIRAYFFSSSSLSNNHSKDPNSIDDVKEGEGVFRFDPSDGEPEMTPTREGGTSDKQHQWNASTDGGPKMAKQTIDNVWDAAKETADKIKEAVTGDDEREKKGYDVPASDNRVDDLRKKAGGYH